MAADKNDKKYLAFVSYLEDEICVVIFHSTLKCRLSTTFYDPKAFIDSIPTLFNESFFAVILCMEPFTKSADYSCSYKYCKALKELFILKNIPHYFLTSCQLLKSNVFVAANFNPSFGDSVIEISMKSDSFHVTEYSFTKDGYKRIGYRDIKFDDSKSDDILRTEILGNCDPKKIIAYTYDKEDGSNSAMKLLLKKLFKSKILIMLKSIHANPEKNAFEIGKWFLDRSYTKFYPLPTLTSFYYVFGIIGDFKMSPVIQTKESENLPLEKICEIPRHIQQILIFQKSAFSVDFLFCLKISENTSHRKTIILKVDSEHFPSIEIRGTVISKIKNFSTFLDKKKFENKFPVIGFFDCSSVICVERNGKYEFMEEWNGLYGNGLFINLNFERPQIGLKTIEAHKTKFSAVVYDIIKIMSMPPDNIKIDQNWKFAITKDSNNPVVLEFDNFAGEKKKATPAFLMALLLKEHFKVIKDKIGEKPKEIGFYFFDQFTDIERKRVEDGISESCKLLNPSIKCYFI